MKLIKGIIFMTLGFGSGVVIAGAVFAFIAIIGVVPRIAQKTNTKEYIRTYESAIIIGGIAGTCSLMGNWYIPTAAPFVMLLMLLTGVFYGCLAVSLAEVLDVIPILARRGRLKKGIKYFVTALAIGKLAGSVLYYTVPGFFAD
ncbi:MAG: stage V sporulation protein AB [Firmicutes bacterium]|nr:stage V sporulation protein AB [Bacillota bacterium]